ncbi:MAG: hypothetical protein ACPG4N_08150, partial [Gammaproteobacteria bacterium]
MIHYLLKHWRGQHDLVWAFWVNLVGLRAVISGVQALLAPEPEQDYSAFPLPVLVAAVLFHGVTFIWQAVGVIRSGERHLAETGYQAPIQGTQAGLVIAFWFAISDSWGLYIMTVPVPVEEVDFATRMDREHASRYQLNWVDDNTGLILNGEIALGITKAMRKAITDNPELQRIELNSPGGNIYEARGLAKLFREYRLATVVTDTCSSACAVSFIGGHQRQLKPGGRIGFHQYRLDADYDVPFINPAKEQEH